MKRGPAGMRGLTFAAIAGAIAASAGPARGQVNGNIDVSTVPGRTALQLTIYNAEDLTLVREVRPLTVHEGENRLQFSWAGTLIDPTSVHLRFPRHGHAVEIIETTFPHDRPQVLAWTVDSAVSGAVDAEITYFTSGVSWAADYVAVADSAERALALSGHVRISNESGAEFPHAQVRLVVGEINLIETVRSLAERGMLREKDLREYAQRGRRGQWDDRAEEEYNVELGMRMDMDMPSAGAGFGGGQSAPKQIIKEGLSEYFIFTVPGTETIAQGWAKRLRLFEGVSIEHETKYRYRPMEYGDRLARLFIVRNTEENDLGSTPLPNGMVRLFRTNPDDSLSFLVGHPTKYVPIGQEIEINLGVDPEVIHERVRLRSWRDDFWFQGRKAREYFSPTQGRRILPNSTVAGWDEHERWVERIRNFRSHAIEVEVRRTLPGHVVFTSALAAALHDYQTPQLTAEIPPATSRDLAYTVTTRQGINQKQNRVTLADE